MKSHSQARAALAGDYHLASAEGKRCQFYIHDWPWPSSDLMVWWYDDVVCPVSCGCGCGCLVRRFITLCSLTNQIASQCHCLSVYLLRYLVLDIQISNKWNQNKSPCPLSTRVCRFKCTTMALILTQFIDKSWLDILVQFCTIRIFIYLFAMPLPDLLTMSTHAPCCRPRPVSTTR